MAPVAPNLIVIAGPNGAGKSTIAPSLLKGALAVTQFVNADTIAEGLSAFDPASAAFEAARVMHGRIRELAARRVDFAFETTLASRSLAPWIADLCRQGYAFSLLFLWLPSEDLAVKRVAERVHMGGHDVPEETIRRRYRVGIRNFFRLYQPLTALWRVYDTSGSAGPRLVAAGGGPSVRRVADPSAWARMKSQADEPNLGTTESASGV